MTNKEKVDILLKYFGTPLGIIDLSFIDFGDRVVDNGHQKAYKIFNGRQKANEIFNGRQKANEIFNSFQEANEIFNRYQKTNKIYNTGQKAKVIYNDNQVIKPNYEAMSKEELIEEIKSMLIKGEVE